MSLSIYVQSRGRGPKHDYDWVKVTSAGQELSKSPMPEEISTIIDPDAFSLVLARYNRKLLLLISGLDAKEEQVDYQGRLVRHSILCIGGQSDEDEVLLRGLAVKALRDRAEMARLVDRHVDFDSLEEENGFKVKPALIEELSEFRASASKSDLGPQKKEEVKAQKNSEELWEELAEELDAYQLPKREGRLVVVTKIKEAQRLKEAGVWRGVSELDSQSSGSREKIESGAKVAGPVLLLGFAIWTLHPPYIALVAVVTGFLLYKETRLRKK